MKLRERLRLTVVCKVCLLVIASLGQSVALFAADKQPAKPSLDEQLLDSLNSELLEGLETVPPDESAKETSKDGAPDVAMTDEDAFTRISKRMREVEHLIAKAGFSPLGWRAVTAAHTPSQSQDSPSSSSCLRWSPDTC